MFVARAWKTNPEYVAKKPVGTVNKWYYEAMKEIEERNKPEK